jgi:hypothetical protein
MVTMRRLLTLTIHSVVLTYAQAPDTRQAAMQYLQQTLTWPTPVKWVQTPGIPEQPDVTVDAADILTDVAADASACTISFKTERVFSNYRYSLAWKLPLREIDKTSVETFEAYTERTRVRPDGHSLKTTPTVYVLSISAAPGRKFPVHRWSRNEDNQVIERDLNQSPAIIVVGEEAAAQEIARAIEKAKTVCGS